MGLVSPAQVSDGDTAEASDINGPINTIANEFNGNIDNSNIKSGAAIATSKLADDAGITNAKLSTDISPAKFANPYKFSAYRSTGQTISTSATKVQFDTEDYDTGSNYDNATNYRFTAPVAGFYVFNARVEWGSTSSMTRAILELYKNGSTYLRLGDTTNTSGSAGQVNGLAVLSLAANDYIEIYCQSVGASFTASNGTGPRVTNFSGFLLSAT